MIPNLFGEVFLDRNHYVIKTSRYTCHYFYPFHRRRRRKEKSNPSDYLHQLDLCVFPLIVHLRSTADIDLDLLVDYFSSRNVRVVTTHEDSAAAFFLRHKMFVPSVQVAERHLCRYSRMELSLDLIRRLQCSKDDDDASSSLLETAVASHPGFAYRLVVGFIETSLFSDVSPAVLKTLLTRFGNFFLPFSYLKLVPLDDVVGVRGETLREWAIWTIVRGRLDAEAVLPSILKEEIECFRRKMILKAIAQWRTASSSR